MKRKEYRLSSPGGTIAAGAFACLSILRTAHLSMKGH